MRDNSSALFLAETLYMLFFFSIWVFSHEHSRITGLQGKEEGIFFNSSLPLLLLTKVTHQSANSDLPLFALKFTKFFMSFLKPRASFSSSFASLSTVMRDNSFVLFRLKLNMLSTKGTHQVQIFRLSTARIKINQIPCHFSSQK